jgi:hypothetical protein
MTSHREALIDSYRRDLETCLAGQSLLHLLSECELYTVNKKLTDMDPGELLASRLFEFAGHADDCWLINELAAVLAERDIDEGRS